MSIGPVQILIVVAIILLFFGPKRLPSLARSLGESIKGFKKSMSEGDDEGSRDVTNSALADAPKSEAASKETKKEEV